MLLRSLFLSQVQLSHVTLVFSPIGWTNLWCHQPLWKSEMLKVKETTCGLLLPTTVSSSKPFHTGKRWLPQLHATLEGLCSSTKSTTSTPACRVRHQEMSRAAWNAVLLEHKDITGSSEHLKQLSTGPKWVTVDCVYGFSCSQWSPHCYRTSVLLNAAVLPALPHPETALVGDLFCTSLFL